MIIFAGIQITGKHDVIDVKQQELMFEWQKTECLYALASSAEKEGDLGAAGAA